MNKVLKAKWIAALRSGGYKQITGELRAGDGFCCLGVLCEVAGIPRVEYDCGYEFHDPCQSEESLIFGPLSDGLPQDTLSSMNDGGDDFEVIAEWIDANIPADEAA